MGGIDWAAMDSIIEMIGIHDPDILIHQLVAIRDWQKDNRD